MKTYSFTKTLLAVIALALIVIAGHDAFTHSTSVQAASQQKWAYKTVYVRYAWANNSVTGISGITIDGTQLTSPPNLADVMNGLGNDGWELVSRAPYSTWVANGSFAGLTTGELLTFKHPV
jgi:hypothetical protein